jgi:glycosyltransferase involved in cell wall biosynthesis
MRLAILGARGIPARYGGFETFAEKLAIGLAERGVAVTVFCELDEDASPTSYQGVALRYITAPNLGPLRTILFDLRSLWTARKGYDVVYMLGYGAAPFCLIPRLWGNEVWINPDGLEWARAKWGFAAKSYFRLMEWVSVRVANRVIADAAAIAACLRKRHGEPKACSVIAYGCELIENPPATEELAEWSLTPGSYYIVVCRLEPENHVLEILEGFRRSQTGKRLIVVGNHKLQNAYVAKLLGACTEKVQMIGTIYDRNKLAALRYYAFGYLHGHSVGGTNPSLLEAMGCGNLILAHDNPFNRETLGENALFFRDAVQLAEQMDEIEGTSIEVEKLRTGAKARARACYQWTQIVEQYSRLLDATAAIREAGSVPS